jgi:diguanylate cyclase (GGDEF)-like protein
MDRLTSRAELEGLLSGRIPHFPPALKTLYETRRGRSRKIHLATALGLIATSVLIAATLDLFYHSPDFSRYLALRAGVALLCGVGAAAILRGPSGLWEAVGYGVPVVGMAALSASIAAFGQPATVDRNIVVFLILLAVLCSVPPLPVVAARSLAAFVFGGFLSAFWLVQENAGLRAHLPSFVVGAITLAIGAVLAVRREASRRREFLHVLQAELSAAELRRVNAELERLMNTDALTGVANRRRFEADMRAAWQAQSSPVPSASPPGEEAGASSVGLILADVDHFKAFNDSAGHAEGDACLCAIAAAIAGVVRGGAFRVARWGGEEFTVLAPGIGRADMPGLAERVRAAVEALRLAHPAMPDRTVTVSVGAAWCGGEVHLETPDALLREADRALYLAKQRGRNRCEMGQPLPRSAAA